MRNTGKSLSVIYAAVATAVGHWPECKNAIVTVDHPEEVKECIEQAVGAICILRDGRIYGVLPQKRSFVIEVRPHREQCFK